MITAAFLVGLFTAGFVFGWTVLARKGRPKTPILPPGNVRQIARERRRNRADLDGLSTIGRSSVVRTAVPFTPHTDGPGVVRLEYRRGASDRLKVERLPAPPSLADFDNDAETHP